MKSVSLTASARALGKRAGSKKLRESGIVPAVIYGGKLQPQNLEVNSRAMEELIKHSVSENILVDLSVKDDARAQRLALVQEVQHHPLTGKVVHVDFHEIAPDEKVTIMVPVEGVGEPEGVKSEGGVLEHNAHKVKARGLAKDLPDEITVDVSALKLNQAIHLKDLKVPANVLLLGDKDSLVLSVVKPREEEIPTPAEGAAATAEGAAGEVEMIKEKKEEGAEGAAPAKGGDKAAPAAKGGDKAAAAKGGDKAAAPAADKKKK